MKIVLLIAEVLFTVFTIRRKLSKTKDGKFRYIGFGGVKIISAMIAISFINFLTVVGIFDSTGYLFDMVFLGFVIIELLFG